MIQLGLEIKQLIEESRLNVAVSVNAELTLLYWNIGKQINSEILKSQRAEYGKQIVNSLSVQLVKDYGSGWSEKQLRHCLGNMQTVSEEQILYMSRRQ